MRLSAVDGTAFVDFSAANVLTDHIGKRLTVLDSAGKKLIGFIKAVGTGETYTEKVINGGFDTDTTEWTIYDARCTLASIAGGQAGNCLEVTRATDGAEFVYQNITGIIGALYIFSRYAKSGTSGNESSGYGVYSTNVAAGIVTVVIDTTASWVAGAFKWVADRTGLSVAVAKRTNTVGTMLFDEVSFKQVLTPAATGVTIVSTPGGTVFNWASKESGFNYKDAAGYEYLITNQRAIFANYYRQMRAA